MAEIIFAKPPIIEELSVTILAAFQVPKPSVPHLLHSISHFTFQHVKLETKENDGFAKMPFLIS